ncbi:fasciclin-1-like [Formica exsecta]|uniref:fasciclin-1-like n=1 Tax=Formica exsecta TaxID=72781 RepID=UPI0011446905|nr:fasciclin-1-like [Formica exsecta]
MLTFLFAAALVVATPRIHASHVTMDAKIRDDSDLSQFYQLLEASQVANTTLTYRHVTVFAPTNRAFQKYNGSTKNLVLYHMSNRPLTIEELRDSISSELEGNPPLWITRTPGKYTADVYINNAKILLEQSNFQSKLKVNGDTMIQRQSQQTSFLLQPEPRPQKIDKQVIDGHVLPNEVLFTAPTPDNTEYKTLVFSDNLKVTVSFLKAHNKVYVQSNTLMGDSNHPTGVVLAEIVKANIPVRNGVVHLIQRPLMVVDTTVRDFLERQSQQTSFLLQPEPRPQKIDKQVIDGHVLPNEVLFTAPTPDNTEYKTLVFSDNLKVTVSFLKAHNKGNNDRSNTL